MHLSAGEGWAADGETVVPEHRPSTDCCCVTDSLLSVPAADKR